MSEDSIHTEVDADADTNAVRDPAEMYPHAIHRPANPSIVALPAIATLFLLSMLTHVTNSWIPAVAALLSIALYPIAVWAYSALRTRRIIPAKTLQLHKHLELERTVPKACATLCLVLWLQILVLNVGLYIAFGTSLSFSASLLFTQTTAFVLSAAAATGAYVVTAGILNTKGDDLYCGKCGHNFKKNLVDRCPECGQIWSEARPLIMGRVGTNPRKLAAGIAVLAISGLLLLPSIRLTDAMTPGMPTAVLLNRAASLHVPPNASIWDELLSRSLTPRQQSRLTTAMLRQGTNDGMRGTRSWVLQTTLSANGSKIASCPDR